MTAELMLETQGTAQRFKSLGAVMTNERAKQENTNQRCLTNRFRFYQSSSPRDHSSSKTEQGLTHSSGILILECDWETCNITAIEFSTKIKKKIYRKIKSC